jgi:hypothetical protein
MGADYQDVDVLSAPVLTATDFQDRISSWLATVDERGQKSRAVVVHFNKVKEELNKRGINFSMVVEESCRK